MALNFLKNVQIEEVSAPTRKGSGLKKEWNPPVALLAIRLWKDGSVFPSKALIEALGLEYRDRVVTQEPATTEPDAKMKDVISFPNGRGNGLDVIDTREWSSWKVADTTDMSNYAILVNVIDREQGRVDLFGQVNYEQNKPVTSVLNQGSSTWGKKYLIPMVEQIYGIKLDENKEYVDLLVLDSLEGFNFNGLSRETGIFPKYDSKGEIEPIKRRVQTNIYGLIPAEVAGITAGAAPDAKEEVAVEAPDEKPEDNSGEGSTELSESPFPTGL